MSKLITAEKRLLCITGTLDCGGAETFLMKIFRRLDREKYMMDFCITVPDKCYYDEEVESLGGKIYRITPKSESLSRFKKGLYEVVKSGGYENVLRVTSTPIGFLDVKVAKKAGAKLCAVRSSNSSEGGGIVSRLGAVIGRALYGKYADVRIAPSDLAAIHTFGKRAYETGEVSILHNAIDPDIYRFDPKARKLIRKELGIADTELLIGHIGRFVEQKNHVFLLDAFAGCLKKRPDCHLVLAGKGELEDEIKAKAEKLGINEKIIFTGVRSDVPELLSAMDVFALPSHFEGMPNTVIEAQATGLPCIVADTVTREADITGLVHYIPIDNMSVELWSDALLDAKLNNRISQKEVFIKKRYDIDSVVMDFVKLAFGEENTTEPSAE